MGVTLDEKVLKRVQDYFCNATNVFAVCIDEHGQWMSDFTGKDEEVSRIKEYIKPERFNAIYQRVSSSKLEDQVIEDTEYPNLKIAAISIKEENKPILSWLVCCVLEDADCTECSMEPLSGFETTTTMAGFVNALDLARVLATIVIRAKAGMEKATAENTKSQYSQKEMSLSLKRIEAVTAIVQLLESEETIENVVSEILKTAGTYLDISSAQVFRLHRDGEKMDVLAEWCNQGIVSYFDKTQQIDRNIMLGYDKPLIISSDTKLRQEEKEILKAAHIKGTILIPIFINGKPTMYACFNECKENKFWNLDEVKFTSDTAKVIQSILVRRIQKDSLASSYASLEAILDNVGSCIYVKDLETKQLLFVNRMFKTNFAKELENNTLNEIFEQGSGNGETEGAKEIYHEPSEKWYDLYHTFISWVDGRKVALGVIYDITDKKIYQKKIEKQAYTDFLTGLYNRMCCERDLAAHIDSAKKEHTTGALLYLDLDDFKHINDGLGHQYGDVLLKAISHSLQGIEGISSTCYRMGGDEFVIIVPPVYYPKLNLILEEIKGIFSKPWFLKDADYYCTMSMGTVTFPNEGESVHDLIKKADIAMYEAKKSGKNRVARYSKNIASSSNKRLDMEKNMRDATVGGYQEFEVYYQPIIDIQKEGNPCTGAEALLRWNSTELGFISPNEFIPLAEYLGLINPIGNYVLKEACKECKKWNDSGKPHFKVNVNLSVIQLLQSDIVEKVEEAIKETGINPHNLTLEVTESLAINDIDRMKKILASIKALGVRIALDDFGTGYSSLNHIRQIPFDVIKVDQSFVVDLADDTYSQSFIKLVSELADNIGVNICIEGIETKEQYKVLEGMKVSLIQGYYFDKPMPKEKFEEKYLHIGSETDGAMSSLLET